jgi:hypothetical protein
MIKISQYRSYLLRRTDISTHIDSIPAVIVLEQPLRHGQRMCAHVAHSTESSIGVTGVVIHTRVALSRYNSSTVLVA